MSRAQYETIKHTKDYENLKTYQKHRKTIDTNHKMTCMLELYI